MCLGGQGAQHRVQGLSGVGKGRYRVLEPKWDNEGIHVGVMVKDWHESAYK